MKTQKSMVLAHLKVRSITSWMAIQKYRITRLAAVIHLLRNDGHVIKTVMKNYKGKNFAEYFLVEEKVNDNVTVIY